MLETTRKQHLMQRQVDTAVAGSKKLYVAVENRAKLSPMRYVSPHELLDEVKAEKNGMSAVELFTRADEKYVKHKEKWCAAAFSAGYAQHLAPCEVAMSEAAADSADFYLRTAAGTFPFQLTEVIESDRRRGDEYRQLEMQSTKLLHFEPVDVATARQLIQLAVERKTKKRYSDATDLNLLLYVNVGVFGLPYTDLIEAALPAAVPFRSCWAITSQLIACVQSDEALGSFIGWGAIE